MTRRSAAYLALALALVLTSGPVAIVHAGPGDATTFENQLKTGIRYLADAERAYVRGDDRSRETFARQAEDIFVQLARSKPRDLRPYLFGGQAAAFRGDVNRAWKWVEQYRVRTPYGEKDPDLHYLRAVVLVLAANQPGRAVRALNAMRVHNPNARPAERDTLMYMARTNYGNQLLGSREYDNAIKQFKEATRLARRHGWRNKELAAMGNAGVALRIGSQWQAAERVFQELLKIAPDNVLWHWHMGLTYAGHLKFAEAIDHYERVIELRAKGRVPAAHRSELDLVFLRIGNCHRNLAGSAAVTPTEQTQNYEAARANIAKYIELHPDDARGHKWLGHLYYPDLDEPYAAIPHFEKAFALDPDCDTSLRSLVQIYERYPPKPVEGESAADAEKRLEAWRAKGAAMKKDLEENYDERQKVLLEREKGRAEGDNNCE